jgi:hypothetical protein
VDVDEPLPQRRPRVAAGGGLLIGTVTHRAIIARPHRTSDVRSTARAAYRGRP